MKNDINVQKWLQWMPTRLDLIGNYQTNQIVDQPNYFKIIISKIDSLERVEIIFNKSVWAYSRTSESFRQNIFKTLSLEYGDDFYINWSFFKIERSSYIKWLNQESCGIVNQLELAHYVIMTLDDVIDIAASYEPEVKIISK